MLLNIRSCTSSRRWLLVALLGAGVPAQAHELYVSGYRSATVHRFDETTGAHLGDLGSVPGAQTVRYGPDGLLYICAEEDDRIVRYDGPTFVDDFVFDDPGTPEDETGGLDAPTCAVFGPDGNLYVGSFTSHEIFRYDGATGAFIDKFVSAGDGGLDGPDAGVVFGPDGHLYVPSFNSSQVLRYDGKTGAFMDVFIDAGTGGLRNPRMLRFRGNGRLWLSSWGNNSILRFEADGTFIDRFIRSTRPTGFAFGPHDRDVYVTSDVLNSVRIFDRETGVYLGDRVPGGGVIDGGTYLEFYPDPYIRLDRLAPGQSGTTNTLAVRGALPNAPLILVVGTTLASLPLPGCQGEVFGIGDPLFLFLQADAQGTLSLSGPLGGDTAGLTVLFQFLELSDCRVSNLVIQTIE